MDRVLKLPLHFQNIFNNIYSGTFLLLDQANMKLKQWVKSIQPFYIPNILLTLRIKESRAFMINGVLVLKSFFDTTIYDVFNRY